jgi:hypothetical protein
MMTSIPVSCSNARMLRPSRPMIRPFISSDGRVTTDTTLSAVWSAAIRWMARPMMFLASRSASRVALSLISRRVLAASDRASSSSPLISCLLASSADIPASASRRFRTRAERPGPPPPRVELPDPESWSAARARPAPAPSLHDDRTCGPGCSRRSSSRASARSSSSRRRPSSRSHSSRVRTAASRPSSSAALRIRSASSWPRRIRAASSSAPARAPGDGSARRASRAPGRRRRRGSPPDEVVHMDDSSKGAGRLWKAMLSIAGLCRRPADPLPEGGKLGRVSRRMQGRTGRFLDLGQQARGAR